MTHRIPALKPKEFVRKLKKAGFYIDHQSGSVMLPFSQGIFKLEPASYRSFSPIVSFLPT